jgi:hypothetical protein
MVILGALNFQFVMEMGVNVSDMLFSQTRVTPMPKFDSSVEKFPWTASI